MENIGTVSNKYKQLMPDLVKYQDLGWDMYDDTYSVELKKDNWLILIRCIDIYDIVLFYNGKGIWSITIPFDRLAISKNKIFDKIFDMLFKLIEVYQEIQ